MGNLAAFLLFTAIGIAIIAITHEIIRSKFPKSRNILERMIYAFDPKSKHVFTGECFATGIFIVTLGIAAIGDGEFSPLANAIIAFMLALPAALALYIYIRFNDAKSEEEEKIEEGIRDRENQERPLKTQESKGQEGAQDELTQKIKEQHRDADTQSEPYLYIINRHARETLALRYGIPHGEGPKFDSNINPERIRIRKTSKIGDAKFYAELPQYRNRKVIAVIEPGTEYVKTFYPLEGPSWWDKNKGWEDTLKGNIGFSIKDMARMHIERMNTMDEKRKN